MEPVQAGPGWEVEEELDRALAQAAVAEPVQVGPEREVEEEEEEPDQARGQAGDSFLCLFLGREGLCPGLREEQPVQRRHRRPLCLCVSHLPGFFGDFVTGEDWTDPRISCGELGRLERAHGHEIVDFYTSH